MARSLWSGAVSFGLINIPVSIMSAKESKGVSFNLLDKRDFGRIGYKQFNKVTGKDVPKDQIVKGYEYNPNEFVIITDKDLEQANPKATQTIDIEDFVNLEDLDLLHFEKPYYLVPARRGEKGYVLLREVLSEANRVAIGKMVLHKKQHLVGIIPRGDYLILEVLRFAHEIAGVEEVNFMADKTDIKKVHLSKREIDMAHQLVEDMTTSWKPEKYRDTYHEDVMKMINYKVKTGKSVATETVDDKKFTSDVVDLMPLLKKSLQSAAGRKKQKTQHRRV